MNRCIICTTDLIGQRWKYCSDSCLNVGTTRDLRKRVTKIELLEIKKEIIYKRIKLNSSKAAFDLIKKMNK